jgi:hypothetical protein
VLEKITQQVGLAPAAAQMHITNCYCPVGFVWHTVIYCNARENNITVVLRVYHGPFVCKRFAFGLAFQDFIKLFFTEFCNLLGVVVEASPIQFQN